MKKFIMAAMLVLGCVGVANATDRVERVRVVDRYGRVQVVERVVVDDHDVERVERVRRVQRFRRGGRVVERVVDRRGRVVERVVVEDRVIVRRRPFFFFGF
jgi:hypothetical protein